MFYSLEIEYEYCRWIFRFSKKRYAEIKETNRRRIAAVKHMKRLKNKKK